MLYSRQHPRNRVHVVLDALPDRATTVANSTWHKFLDFDSHRRHYILPFHPVEGDQVIFTFASAITSALSSTTLAALTLMTRPCRYGVSLNHINSSPPMSDVPSSSGGRRSEIHQYDMICLSVLHRPVQCWTCPVQFSEELCT